MERVLILSPGIPPPRGGLERFSQNLAAVLEGSVDVRGLSFSETSGESGRFRSYGLGAGRLRRAAAVARYSARAGAESLRWADLVHAVTWRAAIPAVLSPVGRPPLVLHAHGSEILRASAAARPLRNLAFRRAAAVVAISEFTARVVRDVTGRRCEVIPNWLHEIPNVPERRIRTGSLVLLSVGRLVERKGHSSLISAAAIAREAGAPYELVIVGCGPLKDTLLRQRSRVGGENWITFRENLSDEELQRLYSEADVFALLSKDIPDEFEGLGIAFLEAAAHGLPVVAGRSGGSHEVVDDEVTGFLADDTEGAARALERLASSPKLRTEMGRQGRELATRFGPDRAGQSLLGLYGRITKGA